MKNDTDSIAKNTGYSKAFIKEVKNYLFYDKHDLGEGKPRRFYADFAIAQSWERLMVGKDIKPHDIILIEHEQLEMELIAKGHTRDEAHRLTSEKFNYDSATEKFYGEINQHKKK